MRKQHFDRYAGICGHGWGPGYGRGREYERTGRAGLPWRNDYLGRCWCGFGPHGFWQEKTTGRIFRGFPGSSSRCGMVYWTEPESSEEELKAELNRLRQEKEDLETRIKSLEEILARKDK